MLDLTVLSVWRVVTIIWLWTCPCLATYVIWLSSL